MSAYFNNYTGYNYDKCAYENEKLLMEEPVKYVLNDVWLNPANHNGLTTVGNMKVYHQNTNMNFPIIGQPTRNRDQHTRTYVKPYGTTPSLGNVAVDRKNIEVDSKILRPTLASVGHPASMISQTILNRWDFVDPAIVQNPDHVIFPISRGGIITNDILRNKNEECPS